MITTQSSIENPIINFLQFAFPELSVGSSRNQRGDVAVRSQRNRDRVSNEGGTSTHRRWDLCQIPTDTPDSFYSWTEQREHDTKLLSFLPGLLGNAGRPNISATGSFIP